MFLCPSPSFINITDNIFLGHILTPSNTVIIVTLKFTNTQTKGVAQKMPSKPANTQVKGVAQKMPPKSVNTQTRGVAKKIPPTQTQTKGSAKKISSTQTQTQTEGAAKNITPTLTKGVAQRIPLKAGKPSHQKKADRCEYYDRDVYISSPRRTSGNSVLANATSSFTARSTGTTHRK